MKLQLAIDAERDSIWCVTENTRSPVLIQRLKRATYIETELLFHEKLEGSDAGKALSERLDHWRSLGYEIEAEQGAPLDTPIYEFALLNNRVPIGEVDVPGIDFVGYARRTPLSERKKRKSPPQKY